MVTPADRREADPGNGEARSVGETAGPLREDEIETPRIVEVDDARRKKLETIRACLALKGYVLREAGGALVIMRWGLFHVALTPEEAEDFARRAGAMP